MKRLVAACCAVVVLAACQTKQVDEMSYAEQGKLAAEIEKRCADQGYPRGSKQFEPCIRHEVNREVATRQNAKQSADRARLALAAGLAGAGQGMQNSAATYRPVNCTTTPRSTFVGGAPSSYSTSCY